MKMHPRMLLTAGIALLIGTLTVPSVGLAGKRVVFGGGPAGGTFQIVANAIQTYGPVKKSRDYRVKAQSSAGSVENLRKVNAGRMQLGVVFSGHIHLGREGKLKHDDRKYDKVLAVAHLYGSPAQLIVRKDSGITSVKDLQDKKVGVGNAGSGAFANCELFFTHLGLWDKIERNAMGYNDAASAFGNNQLDVFWLFTGFPSGAVMTAAQTNDIDLVDLHKDAVESGFYEKYPYFTRIEIPAGTYKGVDKDVPSFQDSALWVANAEVPDDIVYDLLSKLYTEKGLKYMRDQKTTFEEMSLKTGIGGINRNLTPLHPGAERFWKEKGLLP
ncbi:MAG: TAXI family TRAP transporter solute-binding subunit [Candidatus Thiosymbion ectosymbiont of Robbea hypermnestra]|nr:TAXI family TRAP transporter solute-binding subunit [Candidatus Thiosymbion ectosymbiont of Robbea hypermnestra]